MEEDVATLILVGALPACDPISGEGSKEGAYFRHSNK